MNSRRSASILRLSLAWFSLFPSCAAPAACPESGTAPVRIRAVEDRLVLRLDDGRRVRLVGLDPPLGTPETPDRADLAREKLAAMLMGKSVTLALAGAQPDRWGRLPAFVFASEGAAGAPPGGLAVALLAAGLGRYLSEPAAHACRDILLASERQARAARLGLWSDPYYAVLSVADTAGFAERAGTLVLAEGKLIAVQPSPYRTTLRFAPLGGALGQASHGDRMLVATIPPRTMKSFEAQSIDTRPIDSQADGFKASDLRGLIGRDVRFRGLLDLRFGPQVELTGPDDVEIPDRVP